MKRIELYPFEYFDPMRRRWVRGRYVAAIDEIGTRHGAFRIAGAPEVREVPDDWRELTAGNLGLARAACESLNNPGERPPDAGYDSPRPGHPE